MPVTHETVLMHARTVHLRIDCQHGCMQWPLVHSVNKGDKILIARATANDAANLMQQVALKSLKVCQKRKQRPENM